MSTEIQEKEVVKIKQSESLISKRRRKILVDPLDDNNPISIQVLGICSALAVTIKLEPTIVMSISVVFCYDIFKFNNIHDKKLYTSES